MFSRQAALVLKGFSKLHLALYLLGTDQCQRQPNPRWKLSAGQSDCQHQLSGQLYI